MMTNGGHHEDRRAAQEEAGSPQARTIVRGVVCRRNLLRAILMRMRGGAPLLLRAMLVVQVRRLLGGRLPPAAALLGAHACAAARATPQAPVEQVRQGTRQARRVGRAQQHALRLGVGRLRMHNINFHSQVYACGGLPHHQPKSLKRTQLDPALLSASYGARALRYPNISS